MTRDERIGELSYYLDQIALIYPRAQAEGKTYLCQLATAGWRLEALQLMSASL